MEPVDRFWYKVQKSDGCWEWQGCKNRQGYGLATVRGSTMAASRYAYELTFGPVPTEMHVCHHCDNPPCVRPDHLFLGTPQENKDDARRKGRRVGRFPRLGPKPRPHGRKAKLDVEAVAYIRANYVPWKVSLYALAKRFGVDPRTVHRVVTGETWAA
jgi:hypothetical protein